MVVGDDPSNIIGKYDINKKEEPYIKYKYLEAEKYKNSAIKVLEKILESYDKIGIPFTSKDVLEKRLKALKNMSTFEYYQDLTEGLYYDDEGNALTTENKNGHWISCTIGKNFAIPLKLKDGREVYSAKKKDVDWSVMHKHNRNIYLTAWEMVMENKAPNTDEERMIYKAMKNKQAYFSKFKDKEAYADYSTSYWNYAYVDEKNGWIDIDDSNDENEWINNFYHRFVTNLKDDDLITIFECSIYQND